MKSLRGSFLIAKPVLRDPNFTQTVVLMIQHNNEGGFGVVVNRPSTVTSAPFPVLVGGPCESEGLLMVHGHEDWIDNPAERAHRQVAPGIFIGDADCVERVTDEDDSSHLRFRIMVGYAGWGPDQLEHELVSKAWAIKPANGELLFDTPMEKLWENLVPPPSPDYSVN